MTTRAAKLNTDRKISETLLDFAAPLVQDLSMSEAPEAVLREALRVSCTAWNAVVLADVLNDPRHLGRNASPNVS